MRSARELAALLRRLALALFAAALPAGIAAAADGPDIRGIYVIANPYLVAQLAQPATQAAAQQLVTNALAVAGTDGLLIELQWNDVAPHRHVLDWSGLDALVALTTKAGKRFELSIATGGSTPGWVHAGQPAGQPETWAKFPYNDPVWKGCADLSYLDMPAPYDPAFLAAFGDLLSNLAAHLRRAGGYSALTMVKLTGVNAETYELRLPAVDPCEGERSFALWCRLGYTPAAVEAAWATMLGQYAKAFPNKSFNVGFIDANAFPGITDAGVRGDAKLVPKLSASLALALATAAETAFPGRFAMVFDSLVRGTATVRDWVAFQRAADKVGALRGYQTDYWEHASGDLGGAACGGSGSAPIACDGTEADYRALLFAGIYPQGRAATPAARRGQFLEVFPEDAIAYPAATLAAHVALFE